MRLLGHIIFKSFLGARNGVFKRVFLKVSIILKEHFLNICWTKTTLWMDFGDLNEHFNRGIFNRYWTTFNMIFEKCSDFPRLFFFGNFLEFPKAASDLFPKDDFKRGLSKKLKTFNEQMERWFLEAIKNYFEWGFFNCFKELRKSHSGMNFWIVLVRLLVWFFKILKALKNNFK